MVSTMIICLPGLYIKLYIICTVQTVICIELYTHIIPTHSYAYIIIHLYMKAL